MNQELSTATGIDLFELTEGEMFMVWAIRHWVGSVLDHISPESILSFECKSVSMEGLARPIHSLMSSVLPNSINLRWASCMMYQKLVPGEKNILHSIYLAQNNRLDKILRFSRTWLDLAVCRENLNYISVIANTFESQNYRFPSRRVRFFPSSRLSTTSLMRAH